MILMQFTSFKKMSLVFITNRIEPGKECTTVFECEGQVASSHFIWGYEHTYINRAEKKYIENVPITYVFNFENILFPTMDQNFAKRSHHIIYWSICPDTVCVANIIRELGQFKRMRRKNLLPVALLRFSSLELNIVLGWDFFIVAENKFVRSIFSFSWQEIRLFCRIFFPIFRSENWPESWRIEPWIENKWKWDWS
jgi:hypothetical protein